MSVLVFDADGVVCVGGPFTVHLERDHAIPPTLLTPFFHGPFRECIVGQRDLVTELPPVLRAIGWTGGVAEFLEFWFSRENVVDVRLLDVIQHLRTRGVRCVLGTNQERHRLAYLRSVMGFDRAFERVFASCEIGAAKPEAAFFTRVTEALNCLPADITLVDDTDRNVAGARVCGWNAVHYHSIDDLHELEANVSAAGRVTRRT